MSRTRREFLRLAEAGAASSFLAGCQSGGKKEMAGSFDRLKTLRLDEKTLVLFSSDNMPHKEGGADPAFFDSSGGLRGCKRGRYEGGIRVPLIARWPQWIAAGSGSNHVCAFWDFLPTCCELAGVPAPQGIDGLSFLPTLLGRPGEQQEHPASTGSFTSRGRNRPSAWATGRAFD